MPDLAPKDYQYPSTRYSGSKRRLLPWIWECLKTTRFSSVLDVFGGTASTSLLFKRHGKKVHFNDLLRCNQIIGHALIENSDVKVTSEDIEFVLAPHIDTEYPTFISQTFSGLYFLDAENKWLDRTITNIGLVRNRKKRSILMASLFQACLAKRPFNLFHRANLNIRLADVPRTFGNKTTWEHPFSELFLRYIGEYNGSVFSNGRENRMIGGYDALTSPNGVDLVYLDPPYIGREWSEATNYRFLYHFLEGLADYKKWPSQVDLDAKTRRLQPPKVGNRFLSKTDVATATFELLERFQDNILVISYRDAGYPTRENLEAKLRSLGKKVTTYERPHKYALSGVTDNELLIVGR